MRKTTIAFFLLLLLASTTSCAHWAVPSFKLYVGLDTNPQWIAVTK